jgi:hypothetical protein
LRETGWRVLFAGIEALDKMSLPTGIEKTSNFKKCTTEAGMLLKTKDRCEKLGLKRECL